MVPSDTDDDKFYAMKIIKRAKLSSEMAELEALKRLLHENIIRLYEIIDDPAMPNLYLVMDIITGGTIEDKIKDTVDGLSEE
jgi:serine/threonine protein kinase